MRRLATWIISSETGRSDIFTLPQTPKNIADEFEHDLTYPTFLDGQDYFALGVWALPEGCDFPDDLPEAEQSNFYMQAGGLEPCDDRRRARPGPCERVRALRGGPRARQGPGRVGTTVLEQRRRRALHHPRPPRGGLHRPTGRPPLPSLHPHRPDPTTHPPTPHQHLEPNP